MLDVMEREPIAASESDQADLDKINDIIKNYFTNKTLNRAKLVSPDGAEIELPDSIFRFLDQLVFYLLNGQAVSIVPINKELSTQSAADLLNVSRPYLIKLLESGKIPFHLVGTHRRIEFEDLMEYRRKRDLQRREKLDEITRLSEEFGGYD